MALKVEKRFFLLGYLKETIIFAPSFAPRGVATEG